MIKKIQQIFIMILWLTLLSCNGSILEDIPESQTTGLSVEERGIWIVGGISSGAITSTVSQVDLFDPVQGDWHSAKTTLPTPVSFAGVAGVNGKIYIIGGFDSTGTVVNSVQIYDVTTATWSNGAGMTGARANIYAAVIDERIYILGGTTANASVAWAGSTTTYEYTPATDSWATKVAYAGNHSNRLTYAYDDVVYNLGGKSATSTLVATHDGVVATINTLTTGVTEVVLSAIRVGMAGVLYTPDSGPATMIIIGGFSALTNTGCYAFNSATAGTALTTVQMLRYPFAATSTWLTATVLPANVGFGAAAIYETTLYYFGGTGYPASPTSITYSYNLTSGIAGSWTPLESMPISRIGHAAVKVY